MDEPGLLIFAGAIAGTVATTSLSVVHWWGNVKARRDYDRLLSRVPEGARLADLAPRVAELERRLEASRDAVARAEATLAESQVANEQLADARAELLKLDADRKQQEAVRAEVEAKRAELAQVEERLRDAKTAAGEVEERLRERDRLEQRVNELRRQTEEATRAEVMAQARLTQATSELAARERELATREQELARAREELHAARSDTDAIRADALRATQERNFVLDDLARLKQEATAAKKDRDALLSEIERAQHAMNRFKLVKADHEQEIKDLEEEIAKLEREEEKAVSARDKVRDEVTAAEDKLREVTSRQADAEVRVRQLRTEEKAIADSIATLRATHERLLEQLKRTGPNREHAEAELWQPILPRRESGPKKRLEEDALRDVRAHLDGLGLVFPERTLLAFHTSLKVAEQSPLVVLAGISGTGKSELPRRYAEAMGMHFLLMAVQPRWDGPQDLFGFYNYLEQRYRPTELTRALIQMDAIQAAPSRGWMPPKGWLDKHSVSDQMLLVLMDEMNLARVEYYFSDFLSKLETRRGLNRKDASARSKAEVVLEVGPRDEASSSMRLFADTNVLFVGTMNEDESTQTLSDKVVDRANVLRFGRPTRLQRRDLASSAVRTKLPPALTREQFMSWVRDDEDLAALGPRLDQYVSRLNEAMDRVGRPFAHRTHQAIRAYVANYPKPGEEGFRFALGDQIEQRILPKLRGLDLTDPGGGEAFDVVRQVAVELADKSLVESMDVARQLQPHQFSWHGVDRGADADDDGAGGM